MNNGYIMKQQKQKKKKEMEIKTEEVFHNGDAPFNRIHAAVGVYQNTGQGQSYF